jgi:hypothetical protein
MRANNSDFFLRVAVKLFSISLPSPARIAARMKGDPMSVQESEPEPPPAACFAARNRDLLAAEARFGAWAERLVGRIAARAEGGDPVAMRLCMQRAVPVRRGPPLALPPAETPDDARRAMAQIAAALDAGRINIRQAMACLDALGDHVRRLPGVAAVRAAARVEADLAQAMGAMGMDHFFTVPPATRAGSNQTKEPTA